MMKVSRTLLALALLSCALWAGCKKEKPGAGSGSGSGSATAGHGSASGSGSTTAGHGSGSGSAAATRAGSGSASGSGSGTATDDGDSAGSAAAAAPKKPVSPDALFARLLKAIKLKKDQQHKLQALAKQYKGKPASADAMKAIGAALAKILDENQLAAYQLIADEMASK
ncbi:MAG: hypothetical protein KC503_45960 [Myxococcales bacterium]|nr:hypothetical protein [Myxococcales bacterium]